MVLHHSHKTPIHPTCHEILKKSYPPPRVLLIQWLIISLGIKFLSQICPWLASAGIEKMTMALCGATTVSSRRSFLPGKEEGWNGWELDIL